MAETGKPDVEMGNHGHHRGEVHDERWQVGKKRREPQTIEKVAFKKDRASENR